MLDLDEVPDLAKHAWNDRPVVVLDGLADLPEAERPQRPAVLLALADRATGLRDSDFRHRSSPPPAAPPRAPTLARRPGSRYRRGNLPVPPAPPPPARCPGGPPPGRGDPPVSPAPPPPRPLAGRAPPG